MHITRTALFLTFLPMAATAQLTDCDTGVPGETGVWRTGTVTSINYELGTIQVPGQGNIIVRRNVDAILEKANEAGITGNDFLWCFRTSGGSPGIVKAAAATE